MVVLRRISQPENYGDFRVKTFDLVTGEIRFGIEGKPVHARDNLSPFRHQIRDSPVSVRYCPDQSTSSPQLPLISRIAGTPSAGRPREVSRT